MPKESFNSHLPELFISRLCGFDMSMMVNNDHDISQGARVFDDACQGRNTGRKSDDDVDRETDFAAGGRTFDCVGLTAFVDQRPMAWVPA